MDQILQAILILSGLLMLQITQADRSAEESKLVLYPKKIYSRRFLLARLVMMETSGVAADPPVSSSGGDGDASAAAAAEAPAGEEKGHHSPDKSVAGGGVIIGGLAAAIFATVYCYIRVTGKKDEEKLPQSLNPQT